MGNLAFDLTENELEQFFSGIKVSERTLLLDERLHESVQVKSVKIIKSKDEKPKGFGYIEFEDVAGLKDALLKSGSVRPPFLIWVSLLTLLGRTFLDELFELVLLNHVRQFFASPLHRIILKVAKLKKEVDLVVSHLRIMLNLTTHGGVTVHFLICPIPETLHVVGLTQHPMTDPYPVSRKVLTIGALPVHFELPNQKPHLSNVKALVSRLPILKPVRLIKKMFGPLAANLSLLPTVRTRSYQVNSPLIEQRVIWVLPESLQSMKVIGEVLLGPKKSLHAATYHVGLIIHITL